MEILFEYDGWHNGKRVRATQRAVDRVQAVELLARRGIAPMRLQERADGFQIRRFIKELAGSDLPARIAFFRGYAALEAQGVAFERAFALLTKHAPEGHFRDALISVEHAVRSGDRVSEALAARPDDFTQLEVAMIAAGEESRGRAEIFERLAVFLERDALLRKRLIGSLTYPCGVVLVALALIVFILAWLLPTFAHFYTDLAVTMPSIMVMSLAFADLLKQPLTWLVVIAGAVALIVMLNRYLATTEGALLADRLSQSDLRVFGLNLFPFGEIRRKTIASRVGRALAALLRSGVDLDKALDTVAPVAESPIIGTALKGVRSALKRGDASTLSEALTLHRAFDSYILGFVEVGEQTAQLPEMLNRVAEYYDQDVEMQLQVLPEKLHVIVIMLLGFVAVGLGYIVYVPLSSLTGGIH